MDLIDPETKEDMPATAGNDPNTVQGKCESCGWIGGCRKDCEKYVAKEEPDVPDAAVDIKESDEGEAIISMLSFPEALTLMLQGVRVTAGYLPENAFITVKYPKPDSMNTEPYLILATVNDDDRFLACEPWQPGRRSIFSNDWFLFRPDE